MSRLSAVAETMLAALLVAGGPYLFFFGPEGLVMLAYGGNPWLWENFHPHWAKVGIDAQAMLAVLSMLSGAYFFVGVWAAYPRLRPLLAWSTAGLLALVVTMCSQGGGFGL